MTALKRPRHAVPPDLEAALLDRGLMGAYHARPDYQQNDWIGWIERAKREDTRRKRIEEMCGDLMAGDRYMGMDWRPARNRSAGFGGDA
jgi:uncharacterized protein YdeI (YjbR/CyaY-like superfamily)